MCKCLVGFSHTMRVFALLHRSASQVGRVQKLVRQLLLHGLAVAALAREADEPPDAERQPTIGIDLHRNLIVRAADAARFHFEAWLHVLDGLLEDLQRVVAGAILDDVEALVQDPFRKATFAIGHHRVDELADERAVVKRVSYQLALRNLSSTWHKSNSLFRSLRSVLRSPLLAPLDTHRVERAAHHVVANARQILHTAAADE